MSGSNGGEEHVPHPGSCSRGEEEVMGVPARANGPNWAKQPFEPAAFVEMVNTLQKREVELHAAEERYRSMVEAIPALIYAVEPDGVFSTTYISPYVETLLGVPAQEWVADP